jgi:UDP-N-acetylglucosamine transferase subunit ALG13
MAQIGYGKYKPKNMHIIDFCSPEDFNEFVAEARIIIAHAGMGTVAEAITRNKPIIVVPRKVSLYEHFDDHQFETARQLETEGKVLVAYEVSELANKLKQAENFIPTKEQSGKGIIQAVEKFIEKLAAQKCKR